MVKPIRPAAKYQEFEHKVYYFLDGSLDEKKWRIKYKPSTDAGMPDIKLYYKLNTVCGRLELCEDEGGCFLGNPAITIEVSDWRLSHDPKKSMEILDDEIQQASKFSGHFKLLVTPDGFEKGEIVVSDDGEVLILRMEPVLEICRMFEEVWEFYQMPGTTYESCEKGTRIDNFREWMMESLKPCANCNGVTKSYIIQDHTPVKICKNCNTAFGSDEILDLVKFISDDDLDDFKCSKCGEYFEDEEEAIYECTVCAFSENPCYGIGEYYETDVGKPDYFHIEGCNNDALRGSEENWKLTGFNYYCKSCETPHKIIYV